MIVAALFLLGIQIDKMSFSKRGMEFGLSTVVTILVLLFCALLVTNLIGNTTRVGVRTGLDCTLVNGRCTESPNCRPDETHAEGWQCSKKTQICCRPRIGAGTGTESPGGEAAPGEAGTIGDNNLLLLWFLGAEPKFDEAKPVVTNEPLVMEVGKTISFKASADGPEIETTGDHVKVVRKCLGYYYMKGLEHYDKYVEFSVKGKTTYFQNFPCKQDLKETPFQLKFTPNFFHKYVDEHGGELRVVLSAFNNKKCIECSRDFDKPETVSKFFLKDNWAAYIEMPLVLNLPEGTKTPTIEIERVADDKCIAYCYLPAGQSGTNKIEYCKSLILNQPPEGRDCAQWIHTKDYKEPTGSNSLRSRTALSAVGLDLVKRKTTGVLSPNPTRQTYCLYGDMSSSFNTDSLTNQGDYDGINFVEVQEVCKEIAYAESDSKCEGYSKCTDMPKGLCAGPCGEELNCVWASSYKDEEQCVSCTDSICYNFKSWDSCEVETRDIDAGCTMQCKWVRPDLNIVNGECQLCSAFLRDNSGSGSDCEAYKDKTDCHENICKSKFEGQQDECYFNEKQNKCLGCYDIERAIIANQWLGTDDCEIYNYLEIDIAGKEELCNDETYGNPCNYYIDADPKGCVWVDDTIGCQAAHIRQQNNLNLD